ncbi:hypothetical protein Ciccas_010689 [Cichlidogyrus casuarinus]|uniref:Uncharacterized protein n=1 Tax=Cichlidogyrus casuarinus TaxID=1844966 RepID=A0ABD2PVF1_9PLAT
MTLAKQTIFAVRWQERESLLKLEKDSEFSCERVLESILKLFEMADTVDKYRMCYVEDARLIYIDSINLCLLGTKAVSQVDVVFVPEIAAEMNVQALKQFKFDKEDSITELENICRNLSISLTNAEFASAFIHQANGIDTLLQLADDITSNCLVLPVSEPDSSCKDRGIVSIFRSKSNQSKINPVATANMEQDDCIYLQHDPVKQHKDSIWRMICSLLVSLNRFAESGSDLWSQVSAKIANTVQPLFTWKDRVPAHYKLLASILNECETLSTLDCTSFLLGAICTAKLVLQSLI